MRVTLGRGASVLAATFLILSPIQVFADVNVNVSVRITNGPTPNPSSINTDIETYFEAMATTPTPPEGCTLSQPTWTWSFPSIPYIFVQYSADNTNWGASPGGDSEMLTANTQYPNYATLDASFKTGGYWKVTCQASVLYTDSCGTRYSGSATATATMGPVIQVTILRKPDGGASYQPITGANATALPGQYIDLQANVLPAGLAVTYSWSIPGVTFSSYTANNNTATLTQVPAASYKNQTIQFIWADAVNGRVVNCFVSYQGAYCNGSTTMSILAPTIAFSTEQGETQIADDYIDPGTWLALWETFDVDVGINFSANVQSLADLWFEEGKWQFVQVFTPARTQTLPTTEQEHWSLNGQLVLDTQYPYDGPYATGSGSQSTSDSPGNPLDNVYVSGVNNEIFKMYIMFLPPGANSQYVPLQYIQWSWTGTATLSGIVWNLTGANQTVGTATTTSIHPIWTQNFTAGEWVPN